MTELAVATAAEGLGNIGALKGLAHETETGIDVTVDMGPLLRATGFLRQGLVTRVTAEEYRAEVKVVRELREILDE